VGSVRSFVVPEDEREVWTKFVAICRREGKTASAKVWELVKRYVAEHAEERNQTALERYGGDEDPSVEVALLKPYEREAIRRLSEEQLKELLVRAETVSSIARNYIEYRARHPTHEKLGMKDKYCPYCEAAER
jgi:ribosomal protein L33